MAKVRTKNAVHVSLLSFPPCIAISGWDFGASTIRECDSYDAKLDTQNTTGRGTENTAPTLQSIHVNEGTNTDCSATHPPFIIDGEMRVRR